MRKVEKEQNESFGSSAMNSGIQIDIVRDAEEKLNLMVKIARMYYEEDITQAEIAQTLQLSKPMVSRLLTEARQTKLVEVKVNYPWRNSPQLESELMKAYGLQDAMVLNADGLTETEIRKGVGVMGARLVEKYLEYGNTLAISRGSGVYSAVEALQAKPELKVDVVQIQGAMGDLLNDGSDIAMFLRGRYSGTLHFLHAPLILENPISTQILLKEPSIRAVLERAKHADIALVGIGAMDPKVNSLVRNKSLTREELLELSKQGVLGDVAGRFFGKNGEEMVNVEIDHRLVCIELENLRKIPIVIGVATGLPKVEAIKTAISARIVNMLATDSAVAFHLLKG